MNQQQKEMQMGNIEQLKNRDYYLVIDTSGSMETKDCPGGKSRWQALQETTLAVANRLAEYDPDGITIVPFASKHKWYPNTTPGKVADLFKEIEPLGATVLTPALKACFDDYLQNKQKNQAKANGAIVLVVTDGQPNDEDDVAKAIVAFGNKLDTGDAEFGIQLLQVGQDAAASRFLKKLDDDLGKMGAKHDIVDTKTMDEIESIGLTEALLAALTD